MAEIAAITKGDTLAQRAYTAIRDAIRGGAIVPERVYSEAELAGQMGISRTPVREALIEFARQGLIEVLPQKGFRLRSVSAAERAEVFGLRLVIERFVVEQLAKQASDSDIAALRKVLDRQRKSVADPAEFLAADEEFHLLMPRLAGLERSYEMLRTLRGMMWLFGELALAVNERSPHVLEEHRAIVDGIAAHEPRMAIKALREHFDSTAAAAAAVGTN
jgi:DNA-binding GntR family transcriptional regulator